MVSRFSLLHRFICLVWLTGFSLSSIAAEIAVRTDRAEVGINESFVLTFETSGELDGEPDFSPLETNFRVLNTSQSSNISIINGSMTRSKTWTVYLLPRQTGTLSIPAVSFGKDKSPELQIKVGGQSKPNANTGKDVFLEAKIDLQSVYVQQQLLYTLKLYSRVDLVDYEIGNIQLSHSDAVIQSLGEDTQYSTIVGNTNYRVLERKLAIFPQKSGKLLIEATPFAAKLRSNRRQGFFDFDPFNTRGQVIRGQSEPITINVSDIPADYRGKIWLPAESMQLTESWSPEPPIFTLGEPVTRSLTLTATGLTAAQLPELMSRVTGDLKQYPDQPGLEDVASNAGIVGTRVEKLALIPTQPGQYTLPAIEITWWNTKNQRQEVARLPERSIEVSGSVPSQSSTPVPIAESSASPSLALPNTEQAPARSGFWPWLSLLLLLLWISTLIMWWRYAKKHGHIKTEEPVKKRQADPGVLLRQLQIACQKNNPHVAKQSLIEWADIYFANEVIRNLDAVAKQVNQDLSAQIRHLSDCLYRQDSENWTGKDFWNSFERWKQGNKNGKPAMPPALEPLHKI